MSWLLCLLVAAGPLEGRSVDGRPAGAGRRVVVLGADVSDERAAVIEAALRARGLVLVDERAGLDGEELVAVGDREAARGVLLQARAAWREVDFDRAQALSQQAFDEALRLLRPEEHRDLLVDVLLFQATIGLSRNDGSARGALRLATRLEPSREALDGGLHAPSLQQEWLAARADNDADDARAAVAYVVKPRVVGDGDALVEVRVDGAAAQVADGLLRLSAGPHLLTVRAPGTRTVSRVLGRGDVVFEDVLLREHDLATRAALSTRARAGDAQALWPLAESVGSDVVIVVTPAGLIGAAEHASGSVAVAVGGDIVAALDELLTTLSPAASHIVEPPPLEEEEPPWGLFAGVAGTFVIVGAGVLVWQLLPGDPPRPPPRPVSLHGFLP